MRHLAVHVLRWFVVGFLMLVIVRGVLTSESPLHGKQVEDYSHLKFVAARSEDVPLARNRMHVDTAACQPLNGVSECLGKESGILLVSIQQNSAVSRVRLPIPQKFAKPKDAEIFLEFDLVDVAGTATGELLSGSLLWPSADGKLTRLEFRTFVGSRTRVFVERTGSWDPSVTAIDLELEATRTESRYRFKDVAIAWARNARRHYWSRH